jgi:uncharacterized spore protein YtfJ
MAPEIQRVVETATKLGHVEAIFGAPIKLDTQSIVPVGMVVTSFGAGGGGVPLLSGIGGGGDLRVMPVGFLHEREGKVEFTAIELPANLAVAHQRRAPERTSSGLVARLREALNRRRNHGATPPPDGRAAPA